MDHIRASQLFATALENGFGTKCEEQLFSSNCNYPTLNWPKTYLTSVKNATGSVITTTSTLSLTDRKVQGVLWGGKPKKMSFLHGRKLRLAVLHYLLLHGSAGTLNNLCSCTAAPSFTLLPHLRQISHTRDLLSNSLIYGWMGSICVSFLCISRAFQKYSYRINLGIFTIQIWSMGIGIIMHFSIASSGQSLQAPEGFGWQFQSCVLAFWKRATKSQTHHSTEQATESQLQQESN